MASCPRLQISRGRVRYVGGEGKPRALARGIFWDAGAPVRKRVRMLATMKPDGFAACFGTRAILWLNLSGAFVIGLDRICPIAAVACLDDGLDLDLISARSGVRFCSRERATGWRIRTPDPCTEEILPAVGQEVDQILREGPCAKWVLVCPRGNRSLSVFARARGQRAVCPPDALYRWLNHKANFFSGLEALGLPRLSGRWVRANEARYSMLRDELGLPFVLQAAEGQSGSGSYLVRCERDLVDACGRLADAEAWAAPFAGELSLNINAFAMASRVAVAYPSVQLVGLSLVGARPLGYCGNDFTSTASLPREMVIAAQEQVERVGGWLASLGFRGLFGIDFVVERDSGKIFAVDLNPRWQGSTVLEVQAMLRAGRIPLAAAELAYVTGALGENEIAPLLDGFRAPLVGSQLHLTCRTSHAEPTERIVRPGVYDARAGLEFCREGLELADCSAEDEILVCGGVVRPGTRMALGARPARLASLKGAWDPATLRPHPWVSRTVASLYEAFGVTPE